MNKHASAYVVAIMVGILGTLILYNTYVLHVKWRSDMPDDGTIMCAKSGKGFVVVNNPFGFRIDAHPESDQDCSKRMK